MYDVIILGGDHACDPTEIFERDRKDTAPCAQLGGSCVSAEANTPSNADQGGVPQVFGELRTLVRRRRLDQLAQRVRPMLVVDPARLLVLQATAFCNVDCRYCYLPDRGNRSRMSLDTLAATIKFCMRDGLVGPGTTVVWHAGEPLTVPIDWYRRASAMLQRSWSGTNGAGFPRQALQTNATLIDDEWCAFFRDYDVDVGVSLDGPSSTHDAARRTRSGRGTHAAAMRGVAALRRASVDCHVICVVGDHNLDAPDEIMDFLIGEGFSRIGFSVEESEGANTRSSLRSEDAPLRFAAFLDRVLDRAEAAPFPIRIREDDLVRSTLRDDGFGSGNTGMEANPFAIVTVSVDGFVSTFSPELAGLPARPGHPAGYFFGDVRRDRLVDIVERPGFQSVSRAIARGVAACRTECPYFDVCGGGAPSNKLAEHDRFDATETLSCRLSRQVVADVVLARIERTFA